MGNFLNFVGSQGEIKTVCPLINLSLSKIRELHGGFKSICDNFAINLTEFETIFQSNETTFAIWDTDNNGLIDALELFAGLITFADSKAEDKLRFLFDLFDFNEIQSLSSMDLEFAIQCVVISTSKIFNIGADLNELEITTLVRQSFNDGVRITLPQILKWSSNTEEVRQYFNVFRMDGPEMITVKTLSDNEFITYEKFQAQLTAADEEERGAGEKFKPIIPLDSSGRFQGKAAYSLTQNRRALNFRAWLSTALQPIISYRLEQKTVNNFSKVPDELKAKLEWVYGIRSSDTRRALQYTVGSLAADSVGARDNYEKQVQLNNEEIVYYIASVIVLLNINVNKQRFYLSHDQEVICVAVSTDEGLYIASAELASQPAIHVWNRKTLETLTVLKGLHTQGVHLMQFSNDNKYLVTCGLTNPSACIIFDWQTSEVVISTSIHSPTQEIFLLQEIRKDNANQNIIDEEFKEPVDEEEERRKNAIPQSGIVVISLKEIVVFTVKENSFTQTYLPLDQAAEETEVSEPICGIAVIADYKNAYFANLDQELEAKRHLFLTGHKDGKVLLWRSDAFIGVLHDYKDEITFISKCFEGIAICSWRGMIHIWDVHLTRSQKTIDLSSLPFKLLSFNISSVDYNQKRLLVLTISGDVVEISLSESGGTNSNKIKARRINAVTKITGQQKALATLNQIEKAVVIGGDDGLVTTYDIATHELIDVWTVGAKITAIATLSLEEGGFIIAAGTAVGNLIIRQDWEEIIPRYHACGSKTINDLVFSKNGQLLAAASSDKHIYLFQYSDGDYVKLAACKLENGFPVSINFSEDSKKIVVCTNQRKLLLLDPATFQLMFRVEDLAQCFWSNWVGRYPLVTKSQTSGLIPIALGNQSNVVAAGDENGNIYFWRDTESVKEHIGVNLTGHSSPLQRIQFTQDDKRLLSIGGNDECMFQWKVSPVEQKTSQDSTKKEKHAQQIENKIVLEDDSLINELNFCFQHALVEGEGDVAAKTVSDNGVLIRGCNNSAINRLGAKLNFEFEEQSWKRPPAVALVLDHIYGVQTSDRRNTVLYCHFHGDKAAQKQPPNTSITSQLGLIGVNNSRLDQVLPKILGPNFQQLMDPDQAIKYDQVHQTCHKYLVYFTSRFAIVYSPFKNNQTFYQGHSLKISCIQKHPTKRIIATGEVSSSPTIHVWDAQTLESIMVLETSHQGGILHLAFSPDGKKLVSIGMDRTFSIQVFQWEQNRTLAFRNLGYNPVFGLKFYPFENQKFVTCGYEHMAIWRLQGNHLTCQTFQSFESKKASNTNSDDKRLRSVLMSVDFLSFRLGHSIQSDILFGTSQGEITTYCSGRHFLLNENAHKGSVNCLKVSDKVNDTVNIITGGEDGLVKIWDTSFSILQVIDVRTIGQVLKDLKNYRSYGVQSIEMYCCDKQSPRRLLIGLRCGEILEAVITDQEGKAQQQAIAKKAAQAIGSLQQKSAMLNFEFYTYVSAHSSLFMSQNQKKIQCVVNPLLPVMASVGDDETLRFWDLNKKQIIVSKYLGTQATSIQFSPDGSYLLVGLINGVMLVLEAKVEKLNFGTYMEEYSMPTLEVVMSPKEAKSAVVCLKFSYRGDYLAVSFNNEYRGELINKKNLNDTSKNQSQLNQEIGTREPSFVMIYANRLSPKNPGIKLNSKDPYVKLMKLVLPLADFQSSASLRAQLAVTNMDFSECDTYIQMCVQKINHEVILDTATYNQADDVFVIWNIVNNTMVTNFEALKATRWPDWSMAPSINARYHGQDINVDDAIEERQLLFRELSFMSKVSRFGLLDNAICGSHSGGLYVFRFPALTIEKLKVTDFRFDFVKKKEMAATRCFSGHTSVIQSIEIFEDRTVVSTSASDQCIVQWRVEYEDQHWELDFNPIIQESTDPYSEYPSKAKFDKLVNEVWSQRLQVAEINQGVSKKEYADPACEFELEYVIGRRAFDRRQNLKIDCMDRITYQASSLQVFLTENDDVPEYQKTGAESKIKQVFMRPDGSKLKSISPELSCFCLSKDLRILFIATAQIESNVFIWEVTTNMKLGQFIVPNTPIITNIKVAHDSKHILMLVSYFFFLIIQGLTKEYYQVITMVDWTKDNKVLFTRQMLHSLTSKIRDIEFLPNSTRGFVTCGIQHLCFWRVSGSNLEYQIGELTIPKAFSNIGSGAYSHNPANQGKFGMTLVTDEYQQQLFLKPKQSQNQDDDLENIFVTFLNIIYVGDTLITGGDDGFLYLWDRERVIRRVFAHEGSIFALHCNSKLGLVVSGGIEGIVTLWRLLVEQKSNIKSLERLKIYNLRRNMDPQNAVLTPECNVQSVFLGYNKIIVGMRTGSIYEVVISEDRKIIKPHHDATSDPIKRWLKCTDQEMPKSVGIDMISSRIFTITQNGLLSCWELQTFDIIFQKNYGKFARGLQSFRLSNKLMLVFEHEIIVLDTNPKSNSFDEKPDYSLILNTISYATLNQNEQLLGVATLSAAAPEVTLYATDGGFLKLKQIFGFKSSIRYLDFSTDNFYMQVEDNVGEVTLYEIETDRPIQTDAIDFELEWLGEGLRSYSRLKGVRHQYNANNKILKILKLLGKPIVVIADEMGTIRLFNYPNVKGEPYYQCYSDHLFFVSDCTFSHDRLYFISSCEMDRCIFKWKLNFNERKIQDMLEEDMRKLNEISMANKSRSKTLK